MIELIQYTHKELVEIAYKWALTNGKCSFGFKEFKGLTYETPDFIGFNSCESLLIECKCSRSDFFADQKKFHRQKPELGMGNYRLYLCPGGMLKPEEMPPKWGLIYVNEKQKAILVVNPFRKWTEERGQIDDCRFECNKEHERALMFSALRRLHLRGRIEEIYEPGTSKNNRDLLNQQQ